MNSSAREIRTLLMTADTVGGVWTYALELARTLGRRGIDVGLATMGRPLTREQREAARALPNVEVFASSYRLEWMQDPWRDVRDAGEWLLRLEREIRPDLVHLNAYAHAGLGWNAPRLLVAHSDVVSWFRHVRRDAPGREFDRYREVVSAALRAADLVVAPSRAAAEDLRVSYGLERPVKVIPNARSRDGFQPFEKRERILAAGRLWDEAKNIRALDRVARGLDWPVRVAGDPRSPDGSSVALEGAEALGDLPAGRLAREMGEAAIYALPARYEPFGLSVLEAALCGCALVLGDIPSLRENWEGCAIFVDPGDEGALEAALRRLIRDPSERERLASRARDRARFLGTSRMGAAYVEAYAAIARPSLPISPEQHLSENSVSEKLMREL